MVKNLNANTGPYWRMPRSRNPSQSRAIPGQTPRNTSEDGPGGLFLATGLSFVAADAMMDRPRKDIFQRTAAARCCLEAIFKRWQGNIPRTEAANLPAPAKSAAPPTPRADGVRARLCEPFRREK